VALAATRGPRGRGGREDARRLRVTRAQVKGGGKAHKRGLGFVYAQWEMGDVGQVYIIRIALAGFMLYLFRP